MTKVNLADVGEIRLPSAATTINSNNTVIETAFDNTLSRDGSSPNQMNSDLDMNNHDILNIDTAEFENLSVTDLAVSGDLTVNGTPIDEIVGIPGPVGPAGPSGSGIPAGGSIGQLLTKLSTTDFDAAWGTLSIPLTSSIMTGRIPATKLLDGTAGYALIAAGTGSDPVYTGFLQGGTGAAVRTWQSKNQDMICIKDFGAKCDGSTDDTTAVQNAINRAASVGGYVFNPGGVSIISSELTLPFGVNFVGAGMGLSSYKAANNTMLSILNIVSSAGTNLVTGLTFDMNSATGKRGIRVSKSANNYPIYISRCTFINFNLYGIDWQSGDVAIITECFVVSGGGTTAFNFVNDGRNSICNSNYVLGCQGVNVNMTSQGMEGSTFSFNKILPASGGGLNHFSMNFNCGLNISLFGNILDQNTDNVLVVSATAHSVANFTTSGNWFGGTANYGAIVVDGVQNFKSENDTYAGVYAGAGVYLFGNLVQSRSTTIRSANFYYPVPSSRDIQVQNAADVLIDNCDFSSSAPIVESAGGTGISGRVTNCIYRNGLSSISGNLKFGKQLTGMTLSNTGTATIISGTSSIAVTHGLSYTPSAYDIVTVFTASPTSATGFPFWVDTITSTQFTVHVRTDPGVSNLPFSWKVDITR